MPLDTAAQGRFSNLDEPSSLHNSSDDSLYQSKGYCDQHSNIGPSLEDIQ